MDFRPEANLFPLLEGEEFDELVKDIRENGQHYPIVVHKDGGIIDGRNRYRACMKAGVEPKFTFWDGEGSLTAYVISLNLHRRHLTASQKAMAAAEAKPMYEEEARARQLAGVKADLSANLREGSEDNPRANLPEGSKGKASDHVAKAFDVSSRSVETASKVKKKGDESVVDAVKTGDMSLNEASNIVELPPEAQREIVKLPKPERREKMSASGFFPQSFVDDFNKKYKWRHDLETGMKAIADIPVSPAEYAANIPDYMVPHMEPYLAPAAKWLSEFAEEWNKRKQEDANTIECSAVRANKA